MKWIANLAGLCGMMLLCPDNLVAEVPCRGTGPGPLLLHGGGSSSFAEYARLATVYCGRPGLHVLNIVPHDTRDESYREATAGLSNAWATPGVAQVEVLDPSRAEIMAEIAQADIIFFPGGDQGQIIDTMRQVPQVLAAIQRRRREGALVGGTSAGAAVAGGLMLRGGDTADLASIRGGGSLVVQGLGFWPDVITDQHFVRRQRWARLLSAVLDNPRVIGVALDEDAILLVDGDDAEVFGNGATVVIFDARSAHVETVPLGQPQVASGLTLSILASGDVYNWRLGRRALRDRSSRQE